MKVYHGSILSVNRDNDVFQYLVEDRGKIVFVGNELPKKYARAEKTDLGSRALIPPFADTHQHLASFSAFHAGLNVMEASSNNEILDMVKAFASEAESKTLVAFGASPYSVAEERLVSREELDAVTFGKPLFMVKYDGHACVVNTALLNRLPKKIQSLRGYHPDTGEMNQEAFFAVSDYITNSLSIPELIGSMQKAVDFEASRGIGMIHSVSGVGFALNMDISMESWFARSLQNGFQLRIFPQSLNVRTAKARNLPRIGGCFACALDGCFGSQDAAMNAPYANDPTNSGVLYYTDEQVSRFCIDANRAGLQIEMHAIGDRAFDQAARALKAALEDTPREDHRHGIIHACLPTEEGMAISPPVTTPSISTPYFSGNTTLRVFAATRLHRALAFSSGSPPAVSMLEYRGKSRCIVFPGQLLSTISSSYSGMRAISARCISKTQSRPLSRVLSRPMPSCSVCRMAASCSRRKSSDVRSRRYRSTSLLRRRIVSL